MPTHRLRLRTRAVRPAKLSGLCLDHVQPGSYQLARWVSTDKRACVDRTDQLPDGQLGSSPENGVLGSMHERSS